ncbi:MAG: hypothetical protein HQ477_12035 [Chloroflexi bacterium]|nr:hypothetical protein [Chloroflexota bacterium]
MTKIFSIALVLTLVSIITVVGTASASAKGVDKQPIDLSATLFVTGLTPPVTNLNSGWSTIASETLQGNTLVTVNAGPAILGSTVISAAQSSREQFTSFNLAEATVIKGKSKGTFYLTSYFTGDVLVVGDYDLKVSSSVGCQISGVGNWKTKAADSIIAGHGDITVCTNWIWFGPSPEWGGTFMTNVSVTGAAALLD